MESDFPDGVAGAPKVDIVLGRGRLVASGMRGPLGMAVTPTGEVGAGVGEAGFIWWVGEMGADGRLVGRMGSVQTTIPWGSIRVRASGDQPTEIRVLAHGGRDTVLELAGLPAAAVLDTIGHYDALALRADDPPPPAVLSSEPPELVPIDVEVNEDSDEPGELFVGFSDQIAHDYQEMVQQSVKLVRGVPGIARAHQEDTELILAYGTADPVRVKEALHRWWDQHLPGWRAMR